MKAAFGTHEIVRAYSGSAAQWPNCLPSDNNVHISFKYNPVDILAGTHDSSLTQFFSGLSSSAKIYWTYYHEPEDEIRAGLFTAQQYRDAFDHIITLQKRLNKPNLTPTLCLMTYSLTTQSGRNWRDYLPTKVQLLAWDGYYSDEMGTDVSKVFTAARNASAQAGLPWAVAETGVNKMKKSGAVNDTIPLATRWSLLTALAQDIRNSPVKPVFVCYFDSDPPQDLPFSDWRISEDPSMVAAWNLGRMRP